MKQLLLLRHAQAEPKPPLGDDFERVLSSAGRAEAAAVGRYLRKKGLRPDHALVSGARRARETWEAIASALGNGINETVDDSLYSAAPQGLLFEIGRFPDRAERCLVVAHNPAIQALVAGLIGGRSNPEAAKLLKREMPPASLALLSFSVSNWQDVAPGGGALEAFLPPAELNSTLLQ
jgi:phosphohistidine phosphatase